MCEGLIIAIGGCPCSGKTTLGRWIKETYDQVSLLNMDDYYRDMNDPLIPWLTEHGKKVADWEALASMDLPRFLDNFHHHRTSMGCKAILVVEGIFAFAVTEIQKHIRLNYFLDLSQDTALSRRRLKSYLYEEPDDYFVEVAWPVHLKALQNASNQSHIKVLKESLGRERIRGVVAEDIKAWKKRKRKKKRRE